MSGKVFENGSIVAAVWPDGSGELKATFMYDSDADQFCQIPRDTDGPMYIRVSLYDGKFKAFPAPPKEPTND